MLLAEVGDAVWLAAISGALSGVLGVLAKVVALLATSFATDTKDVKAKDVNGRLEDKIKRAMAEALAKRLSPDKPGGR